MSATVTMRRFAESVIALEKRANRSSGATLPAAFYVCGKLRPHLANLMGGTGFAALLSRVLAVASADVPWLRGLQVKADGTLDGWAEIEAQVDPEMGAEGSVVLVAQLLALLAAFIGENLVLRMLHDVWPELSLADFDSKKGDTK